MDNQIRVNNIIKQFEEISVIPHASKHEEDIAKFIAKKCKLLGYKTEIDKSNNVIAEKKVNDDEFIILQAHLDMVCVADENIKYDPLKDSIQVIKDGNVMHANGTSLGGDDGIGVVLALELSKNISKNIRLIFTTDEEAGMTGASNLDSKFLEGKALINIDWEDAETICISSAGGRNILCKKECILEKVDLQEFNQLEVYEIKIAGLKGGHSGVDIDKNIPNAMKVTSEYFKELDQNNIQYRFIKIDGGFATNSICPNVIARFVVSKENGRDVEKTFDLYKKNTLAKINNDGKITLTQILQEDVFVDNEKVEKDKIDVFSSRDSKEIVQFILDVLSGVKSFSELYDGLVESSSNLGTIDTNKNIVVIGALIRSCIDDKIESIYDNYVEKAKENNFKIEITVDNPSWPIKKNSKLLEDFRKVAQETKRKLGVVNVHAGLECSYFCMKNPKLDMISVGPTIIGAHSPQEKIYIDTIQITYDLIEEVIKRI